MPELHNPPKDLAHLKDYGHSNKEDDAFSKELLTGIHHKTGLNQTFFSKKNIQYLQDKIRYRVYRRQPSYFELLRDERFNDRSGILKTRWTEQGGAGPSSSIYENNKNIMIL
jgi:hypothetical protein